MFGKFWQKSVSRDELERLPDGIYHARKEARPWYEGGGLLETHHEGILDIGNNSKLLPDTKAVFVHLTKDKGVFVEPAKQYLDAKNSTGFTLLGKAGNTEKALERMRNHFSNPQNEHWNPVKGIVCENAPNHVVRGLNLSPTVARLGVFAALSAVVLVSASLIPAGKDEEQSS